LIFGYRKAIKILQNDTYKPPAILFERNIWSETLYSLNIKPEIKIMNR
jgi:hypothetical protein